MTPLLLVLLTAWPEKNALVLPPPLPEVRTGRKLRVAVDAGHGVGDNHGNTGCYGQAEEEANLDTALALARHLEATGRFEVRLLRRARGPGYGARIAQAEAFAADAVVSLHTDSRGYPVGWRPWGDERVFALNRDVPGFAVLLSEDGAPPIVRARQKLARALSRRLRQAGFLDYDGQDYGTLYNPDEEAGVWVDKRPRKEAVYFLRASAQVPVVIVETHHALDDREVLRWLEPATHQAFAGAVAAALLDGVAGQASAKR